MPTVPRRQREVFTAPLPAARKRFASTAQAEGAGVEQAKAQAGEAMAGMGAVAARFGAARFTQVVEEERDRADRAALLEAENALSTWESDRLYNPNGGAFTIKGKDSFELPEKISEEYQSVASEAEKKLTTERQKAAFDALRSRRGQNLELTIRRHVYGEMQTYHKAELQANIENGVNTAVANANDPRRVGEELSNVISTIRANAASVGMGAEQIEQQIGKVQTATHAGVIDRLLAQGKDRAAKVYYEETKGQISGEAQARIEKAVEEGTLRGESQRKADEIVATGKTLSEQRDLARAIDDPQLRDHVMQRIEHENVVRERVKREKEEKNSIDAYNIIDKTGSVASIPPGLWTSFDGGQRSAMLSYAKAKAKGVDIETDYSVYYSMMQQAANDPQSFALENLLNSRARLGDVEFKQLADLQLQIKNGNRRTADKDLDAFRTNKQVIDDTLALYNINPNPKPNTPESRTLAQLQRMLGVRMEMLTNLTGKKPANTDVQEALDDLLGQSVETEGSFWNLWQKRSTRLVEATYDDVPASDRKLIEDALRKRNKPITPETVLDLYLEAQARRPK